MVKGAQPIAQHPAPIAQRMLVFGAGLGNFPHLMRRRDHDRAKRGRHAIIQSSPIHCHAKEASCA